MAEKFAITAELQIQLGNLGTIVDSIKNKLAEIGKVKISIDKVESIKDIQDIQNRFKAFTNTVKNTAVRINFNKEAISKDIKGIYSSFNSVFNSFKNRKLNVNINKETFDSDIKYVYASLKPVYSSVDRKKLNVGINRPAFDSDIKYIYANFSAIKKSIGSTLINLGLNKAAFDSDIKYIYASVKPVINSLQSKQVTITVKAIIDQSINTALQAIDKFTNVPAVSIPISINKNGISKLQQLYTILPPISAELQKLSISASNLPTLGQNLLLISKPLRDLAKIAGKSYTFDFKVRDSKFLTNLISLLDRVGKGFTKASTSGLAFRNVLLNINRAYEQLATTVKGIGTVGFNAKNIQPAIRAQGQLTESVEKTRTVLEDLAYQAGITFRRFGIYTIATAGFFRLAFAIRNAVNEFIDFDKELTKVRQVTGESVTTTKRLSDEVTRLATNYGVSSSSILNTSLVLAQAGFTAKEVQEALEALTLTELAPTFENIEDTVEGAIAAMSQFNLETTDLKATLSSINTVSAKFAVESTDIVTAIQKTGGAFASAGGDLNELLGLFTSVRATTRESADTIATGLRTIFSRLQRVRTQEFLRDFGINLNFVSGEAERFGRTTGEFVGPFIAIQRLSEALSKISSRDPRFAQITEELGGFRQINKVIPLIQQNVLAQSAYQVALKGTNSLTKDAVTAQESLANQFTKVKEEFLSLIREFGEDKEIRALITLLLDMTKSIIDVIRYMKDLIPLLVGGGLLAGSIAFSKGLVPFKKGFLKRNKGGIVPGSGTDKDTVPAMLTKGEFVFNKTAVKKLGKDKLKYINDNAQYLNKGGLVGFAKGGLVKDTNVKDTFGGGLFDDDIKELRKIPRYLRDIIEAFGVEIKRVPKISAVFPELKGQRPPGYEEGSTYDDALAVYNPVAKKIAINHYSKSGAVTHELGHAADDALGNISDTSDFIQAYYKDISKLTYENTKKFKYQIQEGGSSGRSEAFAAAFESIFRGSDQQNKDFPKFFPNVVKTVQTKINERAGLPIEAMQPKELIKMMQDPNVSSKKFTKVGTINAAPPIIIPNQNTNIRNKPDNNRNSLKLGIAAAAVPLVLSNLPEIKSLFGGMSDSMRNFTSAIVSGIAQFQLLTLGMKLFDSSLKKSILSVFDLQGKTKTQRLAGKDLGESKTDLRTAFREKRLTKNEIQTTKDDLAILNQERQNNVNRLAIAKQQKKAAGLALVADPLNVSKQQRFQRHADTVTKLRRENVQLSQFAFNTREFINERKNRLDELSASVIPDTQQQRDTKKKAFEKSRARARRVAGIPGRLQTVAKFGIPAVIAGNIAGAGIDSFVGSQLETLRSGGTINKGGTKALAGAGGVLSTAASSAAAGAFIGAFIGPLGAAIGGVSGGLIGGIYGAIASLKEFDTSIQQVDVSKISKDLSASFKSIENKKTDVGTQSFSILSNLNNLQRQLQSTSNVEVRTDIQSTFEGSSLAIGKFVNDLAAQSGSVQNFSQKVNESTQRLIAGILGLSFGDFQKSIADTIKISQDRILVETKLVSAISAFDSQVKSVLNLNSAIAQANNSVIRFSNSLSEFVSGGVGTTKVGSVKFSAEEIGGTSNIKAIQQQTLDFTRQFGQTGNIIGKFVTDAQKAKNILPDLLLKIRSTGSFESASDVSVTLAQELRKANIGPVVANSITTRLSDVLGEEFKDSKFFDSLDKDIEKVISDLTAGINQPIESLNKTQDEVNVKLQEFSDGLSASTNALITITQQISDNISSRSKLVESRAQFLNKPVDQNTLLAIANQVRNVITGGANIGALGRTASLAKANIARLEPQLQQEQDINKRKVLIQQIDAERLALGKANQALNHFANSTTKLTILQEKLSRVQGERENLKNLALERVFGDRGSRRQADRVQISANLAAQTGNIDVVRDSLKGEVLSFFQRFAEQKLPGLNITGNEAIDKILKNKGQGGLVGPGKEENKLQALIEKEILSSIQANETLTKLLADDRTNFSKQLNTDLNTFLTVFGNSLKLGEARKIENEIAVARGDLARKERDAKIIESINKIAPNAIANVSDIVTTQNIIKKQEELTKSTRTGAGLAFQAQGRAEIALDESRRKANILGFGKEIPLTDFTKKRDEILANLPKDVIDKTLEIFQNKNIGIKSTGAGSTINEISAFDALDTALKESLDIVFNQANDAKKRKEEISKNIGGVANFERIFANSERIQKELQKLESKDLNALRISIQGLNNNIQILTQQRAALGFATGGFVSGSGNRDTVPAMLTPKEFVMNASAVKKYGTSFMASVNAQKFAKGGLVESEPLLNKLPEDLRNLLEGSGIKVSRSTKVTDIIPQLRAEQPRGYKPGSSFENVLGVFHRDSKQVALQTNAQPEVLFHEVGHAVDFTLGDLSQQKDFIVAYRKDLAKMSIEVRKQLEYYIQNETAGGRSEAFAHVFGSIMEKTGQYSASKNYFPEVNKYVESIINSQKAGTPTLKTGTPVNIEEFKKDYAKLQDLIRIEKDPIRLLEEVRLAKNKILKSPVKSDISVAKYIQYLKDKEFEYFNKTTKKIKVQSVLPVLPTVQQKQPKPIPVVRKGKPFVKTQPFQPFQQQNTSTAIPMEIPDTVRPTILKPEVKSIQAKITKEMLDRFVPVDITKKQPQVPLTEAYYKTKFDTLLNLYSNIKNERSGINFARLDTIKADAIHELSKNDIANKNKNDYLELISLIDNKKRQANILSKPFAAGGFVSGFGNRDTISARLTPGEYVVKQDSVKKYGAEMMSSINKGTFPQRFASGGLVGNSITIDNESITRLNFVVQSLGNQIESLRKAFASLPTEISLTGRHTVEVIINGAQVLQNINPEIVKLIEYGAKDSINRMLKKKFPLAGKFDG